MLSFPIPADEQQRLEELRYYAILDTPLEKAFDRISSLAARVFDVPIALVSLIDAERQWLKACFGVDLRETSRDFAFCAHAIIKNEVMVVEDATEDPRFADNPFVTGEPRIRFYAGAPLRTPRGTNLGSLCVIDLQPRMFSAADREMLADLAALVVDELELRRASRKLLIEVQERKEAEARLEELANKDPLTNLFNRHGFSSYLEKSVAKASVESPGALLYLDLDSFKIVNDTLGHGAGDRLLVMISDLLRRVTRPGDKLGRFGGDEFVVIIDDAKLLEAMDVAERIRDKMEQFVFIESGESFNVGASIGVTIIDGTTQQEQLLAQADSACYAAKAKGRNRVELFQQNQEEIRRLHEETSMLGTLTEALRANRMELWLQPVVELHSGKVIFHEALLRMRMPNGKIIMPNAFFPAAARYHLLGEIDRYVITQAVRLLRESEGLQLFINLSASSLNEPDLADMIQRTFAENKVGSHRATFEITETELIRNLSTARDMINALRGTGFRFALDDFGSGLSNLTYLKTLPLDFLKIDGSLTRDVHLSMASCGVAKAVNEIAQYLSMRTIAEFVESAEAVPILRSIGIEYGQGYYFGAPRPAKEVLAEL